MPTKRVESVPNALLCNITWKQMRYIKNDKERLAIYDALYDYFQSACIRGVQNVEVPELDISEHGQDILLGLIDGIDEGIEKYWRTVARNSRRKPSESENQDDTRQSPPLAASGDQLPPVETNKAKESLNKAKIKLNKISYILSANAKRVLESDKANTLLQIIDQLNSAGIDVTADVIDGVANKILYEDMDEDKALECIQICIKDNVLSKDYFFKVFNNQERWYKM